VQRKHVVFSGLTLVICLAVLEVAFYGLSWLVPRDFYYRKPTRHEFLAYLRSNIDREVGWVPQPEELSAQGFRAAPAGEHLSSPCVSLYGDSFTFGAEVAPEAAWGNVLTTLLGCRVDNYGVIGYGTDQAYLYFKRHQRDGSDQAPVVILSHLSENIVRNVTQDLGLVYGHGLALKPRYILDAQGRLQLVDLPRLAPEEYDAYVANMAAFLRAEYLLPNQSPLSMRSLFFPYVVSLPYMLTYKRIYQSVLFYAVDVPPWFADLYNPAHPARALQLTREILRNFVQEAKKSGKIPLILMLPTARDLVYFQRTGKWSYDNLVSELSKAAALSVNLGPPLLAKIADSDVCQYFCSNKTTRSGHYTEQGNRVLAEVVQAVLRQRGMLSTGQGSGRHHTRRNGAQDP
jgi:hypothetical protein